MADSADSDNNLVAWFCGKQAQYADRVWLWGKNEGQGREDWEGFNYAMSGKQILALANSLLDLGLQSQARVVLLAENSPYWVMANFAVIAAGGITTPCYTSYRGQDFAHLASDSGAEFAIIGDINLAHLFLQSLEKNSAIGTVIIISAVDNDEWQALQKAFLHVQFYLYKDLIKNSKSHHKDWHALPSYNADSKATVCLIYTSGTATQAIGVELSHKSLLCNVKGALAVINKISFLNQNQERFLSFLPLSHAYEYMCAQFLSASIGAEVFFTGIDNLRHDIGEVKPSLMTAVPRLYESLRLGIRNKIKKSPRPLPFLFELTLKQGQAKYQAKDKLPFYQQFIYALSDLLFAKRIRKSIQKALGGRLKAFISGGAPLDSQVALFFTALDILILQGYGLTEASPVVSVNLPNPNNPKKPDDIYGVGYPLTGVKIKIAEDGEILVSGDLLMNGYWNSPDKTNSAIRDGWLYTGDIGSLDAQGRLHITERKRDIIITKGGDNISPQKLEGKLALHSAIAQAVVYADEKSHLKALIVADKRNTKSAKNTKQDIQKALQDTNAQLDSHEQIRNFTLINSPFTIENGLMTASMKLRRRAILKKYAHRL